MPAESSPASIQAAEQQGTVGAAKAEGVGQDVVQSPLLRLVGNVVELAALPRFIQVDGGRCHLIPEGEHGENRLDGTGSPQQMPGHGLGGALCTPPRRLAMKG